MALTVQQLSAEPGAIENKHNGSKGRQAKILGWQQQFEVFSVPEAPPWPHVD